MRVSVGYQGRGSLTPRDARGTRSAPPQATEPPIPPAPPANGEISRETTGEAGRFRRSAISVRMVIGLRRSVYREKQMR